MPINVVIGIGGFEKEIVRLAGDGGDAHFVDETGEKLGGAAGGPGLVADGEVALLVGETRWE